LFVTFLLAGCGVAGVTSALTPTASLLSTPAETAGQAAPAPATASDTLAAIEGALETIYTQVSPAVVNIQVTQKQAINQPALPDFPGFRFFFGPQGPQNQPEQPQEPQEFFRRGAGSGFVWDKEGHIVTNNHVVEGADKITVTFYDDMTVPAEVVGTDPDSDLAVLKVDLPADRLQPVQLADSTQVKVGQLAVAIGNPFALENTMTVGFISASGRSLPTASGDVPGLAQGPTYTIPDIIQTDAPINPGNSGGVLVDDQGQVIGVTAAIESPVRASAGIGFAIPSAIVDKVVPALIKDGHYDHPWLGLSGMSLTPELVEAMDLATDQRGALVIKVTPGSPADKAGLQGSDRQIKIEDRQLRVGGDVIVAIDGQPVKQFDDVVTYLVRHTEINQKVELTLLRGGKEETVNVTLAGPCPKRPRARPRAAPLATSGSASRA
jgi:2-alkenal reductase